MNLTLRSGTTIRRLCRRLWIGIVCALAAAALPILHCSIALAGEGGTDFDIFRSKHHCEISQRLGILQALQTRRERFLIVALAHQPDRFAQCLFDAASSKLLCEASSGYFTQRGGRPRSFTPSPEAVAAIGRLGFSTDDSKGNFQREIEARTAADLEAAADLLLATLYDAFGAGPHSLLEILAPLAPLTAHDRSRCTPSS